MKIIQTSISIVLLGLLSVSVFSQNIDTSNSRVKTDFKINFKRIGTIKPKNTSDITASNWILGCETLDRDMTDYE